MQRWARPPCEGCGAIQQARHHAAAPPTTVRPTHAMQPALEIVVGNEGAGRRWSELQGHQLLCRQLVRLMLRGCARLAHLCGRAPPGLLNNMTVAVAKPTATQDSRVRKSRGDLAGSNRPRIY